MFEFYLLLLFGTSLILRRSERDITIHVRRWARELLAIIVRF